MKTLHLNLHRKWFDMILSGEKLEEYRDLTPYWENRLVDMKQQLIIEDEPNWHGEIVWKHYDTITFSNGYTKDRPQFEIELKEITIGVGSNPEWGASNEPTFILKLGKIINNENVSKH